MYQRKDDWTVGHWMTPNPRTVTPDLSVRSAFFEMRRMGIRHLLVVDGVRLVGIVTDRDLRRPDMTDEPDGWHDFYQLDKDYEVRHIMTPQVFVVSPGDRLEKALAVFLDRKFGAVPVVDKREMVIGILTSHDLLQALREALPAAREASQA
ncbi:MAG: CBS domain-containing protein [Acidobacteriota bacterium]